MKVLALGKQNKEAARRLAVSMVVDRRKPVPEQKPVVVDPVRQLVAAYNVLDVPGKIRFSQLVWADVLTVFGIA
jgi:hypothetical protein